MGTMSVIVAGGSAATIGGVIPTGRIRRIGAAFEGLIQRGVIPLDAGIDVGNDQTIALHPECRPELVGFGIRDAPVQRVDRSLGDG